MEWWGYLTSGVGAAGGIYGAWRSWRTERRIKPSRTNWIVRHHDANVWELRSNLPGDARDVELDLLGHAVLMLVDGDTTRIPSGGFVLPWFSPRLGAAANMLEVSWTQRTLFRDRRRTERLLIPQARKN